MKNLFLSFILFSLLSGVFFSCKDDSFTGNSSYKISFSADTLSFDTVFTTIVTPTKRIMVYNKTSENIRIENITLFSNSNCFQVNVNGKNGTAFHDVELRSKDSLYIFVQVMVNELGQNAPLHILDSLVFNYNNNTQKIMLQTYGQDVHLLKKVTIEQDTHLTNDKPYLIYDTLTVEDGIKLEIDAGTKFYFHNKATMVVKGSLNIMGDAQNPVIFRGDRLDNLYSGLPYDNLSGQWGGIILTKESTANRINGAMIRNGAFGIQVDSAEMQSGVYRLVISNSQIHNTKQAALKARNANIYVYNSIISNGTYTCVLLEGGEYLFNQCTIADYTKNSRVYGALVLSNHVQFDNNTLIPLKAEFNNCIIYGTFQQEIKTDNLDGNGDATDNFNYKFRSCLIRYQSGKSSELNPNSDAFENVIWNEDPGFLSISEESYDFHIDSLSAAIGKGDPQIITTYPECSTDKDGVSRTPASGKNPDIGAYEYIPETDPN